MDLKTCRLLVTPTSYGKNDPSLKSDLESMVAEVIYNPTGKPLTAAEVASLLPGMDGYIAGLDDISAVALVGADKLKVIARYGVGVDNVDLNAARDKGIIVCNTPGANSSSVAELTIALILSLTRQLPEAFQATRAGKWPRLAGLGLDGKTVGILGIGSIGRLVAQRLIPFNAQVIAHDPFADPVFTEMNRIPLLGMDEVLSRSDIISLHLPLLPETKGMVNSAFIKRMKKGAFLINTARGEVINEDDLYQALSEGYLRGAALDAFVKEPPDPAHPLLSLPNVIATPHLGAQTDSATNAMGLMAMNDCLAVLRGEKPAHPV
jgi:phosphoglycerate dehydrogenase-like enzyme